MHKEAYTVDEVIELTGLSRFLIRKAISSGELTVIRPARRIIIPRWSLDQFLGKNQ